MPSPPSRATSRPSSAPRSTPTSSSNASPTDSTPPLVLVSACLLGRPSRYDGGHKLVPGLPEALAARRVQVLPVCPEADAGLPVPRLPFDLFPSTGGAWRAIDRSGADLTPVLEAWIRRTLPVLRNRPPFLAILKSRSPSCNSVPPRPDGLFAAALRAAFPSLPLFDESSVPRALSLLPACQDLPAAPPLLAPPSGNSVT